jgi:hypothetical protein
MKALMIGSTAAALMLIGTVYASAQSRIYEPGTDCSKLAQAQQIDCKIQQQNSTMVPGGSPLTLPAGPGSGTNQDGTLSPNSSGQSNGSSLGAGGGNGGASPPGQTGN